MENKCQQEKATKLCKREEHMTVLLALSIERELRYNASGTAGYVSDKNAVIEEPEHLVLLRIRYCLPMLLPVNTLRTYLYFCACFMSIGNND